MDGKGFIKTIRLENILSYGPDSTELELSSLNVLIGPNASGKSNLIEALSLLAAAPRDILMPIRLGGGTGEWVWKGTNELKVASIEVIVDNPANRQKPIRYKISFTTSGSHFDLVDESIENEQPDPGYEEPYLFYRYQGGHPVINVRSLKDDDSKGYERSLKREDISLEQSILSQRREPDFYPELSYIAELFQNIRFYREWQFIRGQPPRESQKSDLPRGYLDEQATNLSLVLSNLLRSPDEKRNLLEKLKIFYPLVDDIVVDPIDGTIQTFLHEKGLRHPVPATRLSDGSLRFLCLLVVLCHPNPPSVICIEEPEIGLHPDVIPEVAKLLVEASTRSQIITTTHSDILVDALTEIPESIIVCEKPEISTQLNRLDPERLKHWLAEYRLGDLWTSGELGGNRW